MLLPTGQKLDIPFVMDIISKFTDKMGGIKPTHIIVSDYEWYDLKHEHLMNGGAHNGTPFQEELWIEDVQVISSKEIKCGQFHIAKAEEISFSNLETEKVSLIESQ